MSVHPLLMSASRFLEVGDVEGAMRKMAAYMEMLQRKHDRRVEVSRLQKCPDGDRT